jgi:Capsule assembly protein Wzi
VFGQNSGFVGSWTQTLSNQPFIVGEKLSVKPTSNLELGFSLTTLFGEDPAPPQRRTSCCKRCFRRQTGSLGHLGTMVIAESASISYTPCRGSMGLLSTQTPLRITNRTRGSTGTRLPLHRDGFFYNNSRFRSGYTNDGCLIGSWIGRQGQGARTWATYWLSPKNKIQLNFRHQKVSQQFIPADGSLTDIGVSSDYWVRPNFGIFGMGPAGALAVSGHSANHGAQRDGCRRVSI